MCWQNGGCENRNSNAKQSESAKKIEVVGLLEKKARWNQMNETTSPIRIFVDSNCCYSYALCVFAFEYNIICSYRAFIIGISFFAFAVMDVMLCMRCVIAVLYEENFFFFFFFIRANIQPKMYSDLWIQILNQCHHAIRIRTTEQRKDRIMSCQNMIISCRNGIFVCMCVCVCFCSICACVCAARACVCLCAAQI